MDGADIAYRPITFVLNGGPGMASAWLQMGAIGPWRVRLDVHTDGPSASPVPIANLDTWLDFTDLVFIDPPGTGYSRILTTDNEARRHLWSVAGDIEALATVIRKWLDQYRPDRLSEVHPGRKLWWFPWPQAGAGAASE